MLTSLCLEAGKHASPSDQLSAVRLSGAARGQTCRMLSVVMSVMQIHQLPVQVWAGRPAESVPYDSWTLFHLVSVRKLGLSCMAGNRPCRLLRYPALSFWKRAFGELCLKASASFVAAPAKQHNDQTEFLPQ